MKLNNRAFTLIELLGVIIVLSIIAVIIYPVYNESITNSKNNLYKEQIKSLENNARRWGVDNTSRLPEVKDVYSNMQEACAISFLDLSNDGYIVNSEIINPKNNQPMEGCIVAYWDYDFNQYIYKYSEDCTITGIDVSYCPATITFDICGLNQCEE